MKQYITYHLTKNVPGPKLKIASPEEGFEIIKQWTQKYSVGKYVKISLELTIPHDNYPDVQFLDDEFLREPLSGYVHNGSLVFDVCEWKVVPFRLDKLFKFLREKKEFFDLHEFYIVVFCEFVLLDQKSQLLKGQNLYENGQYSNIFAFIRNGELSVEPSFFLPFENETPQFKVFYKFLEKNFPFKLNYRNLYLQTQNDDPKKGYTSRKLWKLYKKAY